MAFPSCARCGRATGEQRCPYCGLLQSSPAAEPAPVVLEAGSPALLAMPGSGDSVWTRVLLVVTAMVTVAIAGGLLWMTVRSVTGRG